MEITGNDWRARAGATVIFLAAAGVTLWATRSMRGGMTMPGGWTMSMMWMVMPGQSVWAAAAMFLLMWQAMMIAMMLPSSWPMLSLYRRVAMVRRVSGPSLKMLVVGAGYFTVWLGFGLAALAIGLGISSSAMHSAAISRLVPRLAALGLVLAGTYQLTPLKQACLRHCREPVLYLSHTWKPGFRGAVSLGLHHGAFCAACCWALMLIQMLLGMMNLAVMVAIAGIITTEKLWRRGPLLSRMVGIAAVAAGVWAIWPG